jgi:hypothetical protein
VREGPRRGGREKLAVLPAGEHGIEPAEEAGEQGEDERLDGGDRAECLSPIAGMQTQLRREVGEGERQCGGRRGGCRGRGCLRGLRCG